MICSEYRIAVAESKRVLRSTSVAGSASMTLAYDPGGRLRQTVAGGATTQFLYGGKALLAEYDGAGTLLWRYVHGSGIDEPLVWYEGAGLTDRRYLIADRQGSIIAANGASTTRYTYGPYGEPDAWAGSRLRYTGDILPAHAEPETVKTEKAPQLPAGPLDFGAFTLGKPEIRRPLSSLPAIWRAFPSPCPCRYSRQRPVRGPSGPARFHTAGARNRIVPAGRRRGAGRARLQQSR